MCSPRSPAETKGNAEYDQKPCNFFVIKAFDRKEIPKWGKRNDGFYLRKQKRVQIIVLKKSMLENEIVFAHTCARQIF